VKGRGKCEFKKDCLCVREEKREWERKRGKGRVCGREGERERERKREWKFLSRLVCTSISEGSNKDSKVKLTLYRVRKLKRNSFFGLSKKMLKIVNLSTTTVLWTRLVLIQPYNHSSIRFQSDLSFIDQSEREKV